MGLPFGERRGSVGDVCCHVILLFVPSTYLPVPTTYLVWRRFFVPVPDDR